MGLEIKALKNLPNGVDLGASSVKMAQVRMSRAGVELIGAAFAETPADDASKLADHIAAQFKTVAGVLEISLAEAHEIHMRMLSEGLEGPPADDLFRLLGARIAECLRYYESIFVNRAIDRIILIGGQAHNSRLCRCIAERLNLPAQVGDPMAGIRRVEGRQWPVQMDGRQPQPAWAVAVGLSIGANLAA